MKRSKKVLPLPPPPPFGTITDDLLALISDQLQLTLVQLICMEEKGSPLVKRRAMLAEMVTNRRKALGLDVM